MKIKDDSGQMRTIQAGPKAFADKLGMNLLFGDSITVKGSKALIDRQPLQPGDVQRTFADINLARTQLNYNPTTDLAQGLQRFVTWFREYG